MGETRSVRVQQLVCQMPQVLFTEVLTERYAVMYRRFMTRLLSSCARLGKHALSVAGPWAEGRFSKVWPGQPGHLAPPPARGQVAQSLVEPSRGDDTLPRVLSGLPPVSWRQRQRRPLRQDLTPKPGLAAERSQSRRRSTARSMAWAREVTPSFW